MELISYALDFVSFFLQNFKDGEIKSIILFGSAARGEAGKESDVDLFVNIAEDKNLQKKAEKIVESFYDSVKFKKYWTLLDIKNEISVITGDLNKWKLKDSMLGSSIILYQHYAPKLEDGKNKIIIIWGNIKPNSKRVMLNKKLFGYTHYGKQYSGIVQKYNGVKLGSNVIMVDVENFKAFKKVFNSFKVSFKSIRIFRYED